MRRRVHHLADPKVRQRFADLGQEIPPAEQQTAHWLAEFQKAEVDKSVRWSRR